MGYSFIPLVVTVALGFRYLVLRDASRRSKLVVGGVAIVALILWWRHPQWLWLTILLQVAVIIYVLGYFKANPRAL